MPVDKLFTITVAVEVTIKTVQANARERLAVEVHLQSETIRLWTSSTIDADASRWCTAAPNSCIQASKTSLGFFGRADWTAGERYERGKDYDTHPAVLTAKGCRNLKSLMTAMGRKRTLN
jgi:hypothetical protein